jgi:LPXTG-motif cell wall-anchored protein
MKCVHGVNETITAIYGGEQCRNLPHTGTDMVPYVIVGILLLIAGYILWKDYPRD